MPDGFSPDIHSISEHESAKDNETLTQRGELITYDGSKIMGKPIQIALGVPANVAYAQGGDVMQLVYKSETTHEEGEEKVRPPRWYLSEPELQKRGFNTETALIEGIPEVVGRQTFTLQSPEMTAAKTKVSGTHLSIIVGGEHVNIVHQGMNPTYVEAPPGSKQRVVKFPTPTP